MGRPVTRGAPSTGQEAAARQRRRRAWRSGWWESGRGQAASKLGGRVSGTPSLTHVISPRRQPMRRAVRAISAMPPCSSSPQLFIDDSLATRDGTDGGTRARESMGCTFFLGSSLLRKNGEGGVELRYKLDSTW